MIREGHGSLESVRAIWAPDAAGVIREQYGLPCFGMFGMSEGLDLYTKIGDPIEVLDWTVGRPISKCDEVRLLAPGTEEEVGFDEPGELACRGPYTLSGYYNAPERNREAFTSDGFYKSGDLLVKRKVGDDVVYAFAGRTKDIVNRGHEKVSCEEIEKAIATHDSVADCAVVGMPDPVLGERVCAFIVPRSPALALGMTELAAFLEAFGLAKFKWPERIEIVESLPVTRVGKLDKTALRQAIAQTLQQEDAHQRAS